MEATSSQTPCPVFERLQGHISEQTDGLNVFNMAHLHPNFAFNGKPLLLASDSEAAAWEKKPKSVGCKIGDMRS